MVRKFLVANRSEIAIRAFPVAYELGVNSVAVYRYDDRGSEHQLKADETCEIGEPGQPIRVCFAPKVIATAAVQAGTDAVYPGYGVESEKSALVEARGNGGQVEDLLSSEDNYVFIKMNPGTVVISGEVR